MACPLFFLWLGVKPVKVLALDQAIAKTGWSVYTNGKLKKHGLLEFDVGNGTPAERFKESCKAVSKLIVDIKPDVVVMEGVTYQHNMWVLIELAQFQGVLIGTCIRRGIEFAIYHPSTWRKILEFATYKKNRGQLKQLAIQHVKDTFGLDVPEDVAESICIGQAHILNLKGAKQK